MATVLESNRRDPVEVDKDASLMLTGLAALELPAASGGWGALLAYVTLALGFSFLCSLCESVLLSSSRSYLEVLAAQESAVGRLMQSYKADVDRPIAAILTLNTVAHTMGAAGAGAEAAGIFGNQFIGVISAVLTILILVFSEIIPKTLGTLYWQPLVPFTARSIQAMLFVFAPVVTASRALTRRFAPKLTQPTVTRGELEVLAQIGSLEGALTSSEFRILQNLLQLRSVDAEDVMTPRTVLFTLPASATVAEVMAEHHQLPYSRIPLTGEDLDDIQSYVLRSAILAHAAADRHDKVLAEIARPMAMVPPNRNIVQVMDEFVERKEHILLVLDEYGGTQGIVTMEDAIESLLGIEIVDESDLIEDMRAMALQRWEKKRLAQELHRRARGEE